MTGHIFKNNFRFIGLIWDVAKIQFLFKFIQMLITALIPAASIWIIQYLISLMESSAELQASYLTVISAVIGFFIVQFIPQGINLWNSTFNSPKFMWQIKQRITYSLMDKANNLDYSCFENEEFYNKYTHGLAEADSIAFRVFNDFFSFFGSIITLVSIIALIAVTNSIVLLFSVAGVIISFVSSIVTSKINNENEKEIIPSTRYSNYLQSILFDPESAGEVRCNDVASLCKSKYEKTVANIIKLSKKQGKKLLLVYLFFTLMHTLCEVGLYGYVINDVLLGSCTIASFSLLTNSAGQIESALSGITQTISNVYANSLKIDNLLYILDYKSEAKNTEGITLDKNEACSVEFSHVSFRYPNTENYALKDVSFYVRPGEKIAIAGENGSGKTTLVKLLLKLYLPENGDIKINGISIYDIADDDYRRKIGVVFQNYRIFEFTISENINFSNDVNASTEVNADKIGVNKILDRCADKWDTVLSKRFGKNGTLLSGGEMQKIAYLRALSKDAFMYIMDEPSSSLDPRSEYNMNQLSYSLKDKTMFLTSHRLSSTVMADRIFYFEKGELIEHGTHNELMALSGKYAELFNLQAEKYNT